MIDGETWEGVQSLLDQYVAISNQDVVVLLYTSDSYEPAAWVSAALELRGIPVERVWMAPLQDGGFSDRLSSALPAPSEFGGRLVVLSFERDTMSHTSALTAALSHYDKHSYVVLRAISSCRHLFADTMTLSPMELTSRNATVLDHLTHATELHITTRGGTDLTVVLDNERHRWISNRGTARPGGTVILPPGEVATFPATINGLLVADFAFNVNAITDRDARLVDRPVYVWIEDGRAVRYECSDGDMASFLTECFESNCANNVGELGFGTNPSIREPIPMNSHINERRPGVHIGFGQHNQDPDVVGYQCSIHLDLIARGGTIWADKGSAGIDLENIMPSPSAHPSTVRDEDVFAPDYDELEVEDCCGMLTSEGLQLFKSLG